MSRTQQKPDWLGNSESVADWWEGYVTTYLERDLRQLAQIDALSDFHRVMQILALRSGQVINQSDICRDAGVSHVGQLGAKAVRADFQRRLEESDSIVESSEGSGEHPKRLCGYRVAR